MQRKKRKVSTGTASESTGAKGGDGRWEMKEQWPSETPAVLPHALGPAGRSAAVLTGRQSPWGLARAGLVGVGGAAPAGQRMPCNDPGRGEGGAKRGASL